MFRYVIEDNDHFHREFRWKWRDVLIVEDYHDLIWSEVRDKRKLIHDLLDH